MDLKISLYEAERHVQSSPNDIAAKLVRVAASLIALRDQYEPIDPNGCLSKSNERAFDVLQSVFPDLENPRDILRRLDTVCSELEPERRFDRNLFSTYSRIPKQARPVLAENQSSSIAILRNQAAYLGLDEDNGFRCLRMYFWFRQVWGPVFYICGAIVIFLSLVTPVALIGRLLAATGIELDTASSLLKTFIGISALSIWVVMGIAFMFCAFIILGRVYEASRALALKWLQDYWN